MCFSNLPIAFDEHGDPYLTDEADDVSDPGTHATTATDCGCVTDDAPLDAADPEEAFADILDSVSEASRSHLTDSGSEGVESEAHGGDAEFEARDVDAGSEARSGDGAPEAGGGRAHGSADGD